MFARGRTRMAQHSVCFLYLTRSEQANRRTGSSLTLQVLPWRLFSKSKYSCTHFFCISRSFLRIKASLRKAVCMFVCFFSQHMHFYRTKIMVTEVFLAFKADVMVSHLFIYVLFPTGRKLGKRQEFHLFIYRFLL